MVLIGRREEAPPTPNPFHFMSERGGGGGGGGGGRGGGARKVPKLLSGVVPAPTLREGNLLRFLGAVFDDTFRPT